MVTMETPLQTKYWLILLDPDGMFNLSKDITVSQYFGNVITEKKSVIFKCLNENKLLFFQLSPILFLNNT